MSWFDTVKQVGELAAKGLRHDDVAPEPRSGVSGTHSFDWLQAVPGVGRGIAGPMSHVVNPLREVSGTAGDITSPIAPGFGPMLDVIDQLRPDTGGRDIELVNQPDRYLKGNRSGLGIEYGGRGKPVHFPGPNPGPLRLFEDLVGDDRRTASFEGSAGLIEGDKDTRFGVKFSAGDKLDFDLPGDVHLDGGSSVNSEWTIGTDGFTAGSGANYAEVNASTKDDPTKGSTTDLPFGTKGRFGYSVGEGFGLRGHWGDKDANGLRDIGYGVDAGPFSMDITTEAHHRLFKTLMGE